MIKKISLFFFCNSIVALVFAQKIAIDDTLQSTPLETVVIKAYAQNRRLIDIPGGINYVDKQMLHRFNNASILNALNATSGVRMEERSPGSYRLSIRGSSLRSPFGVRNVKIYYNNIPFTEPGGTTYLNQLGFYNFGSVEVIKGPGSSLYGAGTGGVMLVESNGISSEKGVSISHTIGSYGMQNSMIGLNAGNDSFRNIIIYQRQSGNGYRQQSAFKRNVFSWETTAKMNETDRLGATFIYGDLYYQTPGALTLNEFNTNPRRSRPRVGSTPGAIEASAAIYQKAFLAGITYNKNINNNWQNTTTAYGAFTKLDNPAIRNYARNFQPHFGGRTLFEFKKQWANANIKWHTGGELQQGYTSARIYNNKSGLPDSLQTDDEINTNTYFVFTQLTYEIKKWIFTTGISLNRSKIQFSRLSNVPATSYNLAFSNQVAPRVAVLYKINNQLSTYASWSKGFSPPTSDELFPTGSLANPNLAAEQGNNAEVGLKGYLLNNRFSFDISAFYFSLNNTIVQRRDSAGGDYYTNAGSTRQRGIESQLSYKLFPQNLFTYSTTIWLSHYYYDFHYKSFKQLANDFSGNELPGVPKHFITAGIDVNSRPGLYANLTYQYSSRVPLNDANTAFAESYNLLTTRLGYKRTFNKIGLELFVGGDNLFNVKYSLGNDINAFGGRYFNAAAGRNYFAGVSVKYNY